MTRWVITPEIAIRLAEENTRIATGAKLVAPTLLPSQVLSILYRRVRDGRLGTDDPYLRAAASTLVPVATIEELIE